MNKNLRSILLFRSATHEPGDLCSDRMRQAAKKTRPSSPKQASSYFGPPNKDRKILLIILFISIVCSLSFINVFTLKEKRNLQLSTIEVLEKQYGKLGFHSEDISQDDIILLKELIEQEKMRYFQTENSDPYRFGLEIIAILESHHLQINGYKTLDHDDSYLLEFSVKGSSYRFFSFLKEIYEKEKNYRFPYFSLKNEKAGISSVFRIGYAVYE